MADLCSALPKFLYPSSNVTLEQALGSQFTPNCTVQLPFSQNCDLALRWMKDGQWLDGDTAQWFNDNATEIFISSTLDVNVTTDESYGVFVCLVRNSSAVFTLQKSVEAAGHFGAVLAACIILTLLLLLSVAYVKCRLNVLLWYQDRYGDLEINACGGLRLESSLSSNTSELFRLFGGSFAPGLSAGGGRDLHAGQMLACKRAQRRRRNLGFSPGKNQDGKLYDAYVSYANSTDDRKFVNFIMKPQLENRYGYKLFLDDKDVLPNSEPSADLIMNVSRCRRLIVILSKAYLEQEWCNSNFREGLWRLLELSQRPIFVAFESQYREIVHPAIDLLKQHKSTVTLLIWHAGSMMPSSDFWKELCLALPRKVSCRGLRGDPQTHLQEDKDPMLTIHSNYLDFRGDSHPEGDAGVHGPIFKGPPPPRMTGSDGPPFSTLEDVQLGENQRNEIDISDLGSRNYGARTDFYCLVTEDDI